MYKIISHTKNNILIDKFILGSWCETNCTMPYDIEETNGDIIIKVEDATDMAMFCMSPEYSIYQSKILLDI